MFDMTNQKLMELIRSDKVKNIILDTDAYNELDDQFCIAYCMRSPDKVNLLSFNAAPFLNSNSVSPEDGMEKSYDEIFKVMKLTDPTADIPVYRGSTTFLKDKNTPVISDAAENIIRTVKNSDEPVIIVCIGAITNLASALIQWPELARHAGLVWLGGHALHFKNTHEFNMYEDIPASQIVFDSEIPMVQLPCEGVVTEFVTSPAELNYYLAGKNPACDYLAGNVDREQKKKYGSSRIIWDVTAAAALICPNGLRFVEIPRPIITSDGYYANDMGRPHYIYVRKIYRDIVFADLFRRLSGDKE